MKNLLIECRQGRTMCLMMALFLLFGASSLRATVHRTEHAKVTTQQINKIIAAKKINSTTIEVLFAENQRMTIDFYGENIFRVFQDNAGGILRGPEAKPEAQILVNMNAYNHDYWKEDEKGMLVDKYLNIHKF